MLREYSSCVLKYTMIYIQKDEAKAHTLISRMERKFKLVLKNVMLPVLPHVYSLNPSTTLKNMQ
jgi:hypothetical protein